MLLVKRFHSYADMLLVMASLFGVALSSSTIVFYCFGIFVPYLEDNFAWSRTQISLGLTVASGVTVIATPIIGGLIDHYGARSILLKSIVLFAIAIASLMLLSDNIWHFYLIYALLPLLGAATTPVSYSQALSNWFDKNRGLALGVALSGAGLGSAVLPPLIIYAINTYGWQGGYLMLAGLVLLFNFPLAYLFFWSRPEECGLTINPREANGQKATPSALNPRAPYQSNADDARSAPPVDHTETLKSLKDRLTSRQFICFAAAMFLLGVPLTGAISHLFPMLIGNGASESQAAYGISVMGVAVITGRIVSGLLMDRFFAPYVAAVFLGCMVIGFFCLTLPFSLLLSYLACACIGVAMGSEFSVLGLLVGRYFGRANYGRIYGLLYAIFILGGGLGVAISGAGYDYFNDYHMVLMLFAACNLLACVLIAALGPYPDNLKDGQGNDRLTSSNVTSSSSRSSSSTSNSVAIDG